MGCRSGTDHCDVEKAKLQDGLVAAKVPCSVINDYGDVFSDPHVQHRGLKQTIEHRDAPNGRIDVIANPIRFSDTPVELPSTPPHLGEHTDEILAEIAGYSSDQIAALRERGAI